MKVAIKRMSETQILEDELKEVSELNSIIFAQKQELEAKLVEERQAKDGKHFHQLFIFVIRSCPSGL
jgi:hypothetical protein